MKIIHLISDISQVNFGIWNAALNTSPTLERDYNVYSEVWYPASDDSSNLKDYDLEVVGLDPEDWASPEKLITYRKLSPENTVIHSHGCWMLPTQFGYRFRQNGFKWVYSPHGMLEPWSRQQKKLKKELYFRFFEKKYALKSDAIRAVGTPEKTNLQKLFPRKKVVLIPNGIQKTALHFKLNPQPNHQTTFLFMARLHHKKGLLPLIKAWINSSLFQDNKYSLKIAGPDDGEQKKMMQMLENMPEGSNIEFLGAIYGEEKDELLQGSTFFILPSYSEGFPTSIVEAMFFGCIPIISDGCNFPETFDKGLAIKTSPREADIVASLEFVRNMPPQKVKELSQMGRKFIMENYSIDTIAKLQYQMYKGLLNGTEG